MKRQAQKRLAAWLPLAAATMILSSCGGSSSHTTPPANLTLTAGNWLLQNDSVVKITLADGSSESGPTGIKLAGDLSSSGATLIPISLNTDPCFPAQTPIVTPLAFTGSGTGNALVFTWPGNSQTYTINAGLVPGNAFVGTYTESGGGSASCTSDNGTVYGTLVPSINGNWSGTLPGQPGTSNTPTIAPTTITASLTQATAISTNPANPAVFSTFPLSGTVNLENPCLSAGALALTIDNTASYIVGDTIVISTKPASDGTVFTIGSHTLLPDPTTATSVTIGTYALANGVCNYTGSSAQGGTQITLAKSS